MGRAGIAANGLMLDKLWFMLVEWWWGLTHVTGIVFATSAAGLAILWARRGAVTSEAAWSLVIFYVTALLMTGLRMVSAPNPVYISGLVLPCALTAAMVLHPLAAQQRMLRWAWGGGACVRGGGGADPGV